MERASEISPGAIRDIYTSGKNFKNPIVQIVDLKKISGQRPEPNAPARYRLSLSDGEHYQQAMLATQLNELVNNGTIIANSLVQLNDFIVNNVQNKRIVIILNIAVLANLPAKVGNPVAVDSALGNGAQTAPPRQIPNQYQQPNHQFRPMPDMKPTSNSSFGLPGTKPWTAPPPDNPYGSKSSSGVMSMTQTTPHSNYRPIQSINPYQNGWTIRGRCTFKSDLRKFQNARGEGQVISFELTDESGSIRVTAFTDHAQSVLDKVHMNRIYKVTRGSLKQANEKYNRSTSSFEMTLDRNSVFEEVQDDGSFMQIKYNFTKIAQLDNIPVKGACDVVGVVTAIGPLGEIIIRSTGEPCEKRSITIADDSNASVELTLWRAQAQNFLTESDLDRHPVLLLRNASRGDFGGVSLNITRSTTIELDPVSVPEANTLRAWFDAGGLNGAVLQSVTNGPGGAGGKVTGERKSLEEARVEDVDPVFATGGGGSNASAMFVMRGVVSFVNMKNDLYYPGDPDTKKKLIESAPGMWQSESTGRQLTDDQVGWRYIVSMKIMDYSSSKWVSGFDEVGQVLFGRDAKEFRELKERDQGLYEHIIEEATFRPLVMKMQVKERMWKDEQQIRYTISRVEPVNFSSEGHQLLKEIGSYGAM